MEALYYFIGQTGDKHILFSNHPSPRK